MSDREPVTGDLFWDCLRCHERRPLVVGEICNCGNVVSSDFAGELVILSTSSDHPVGHIRYLKFVFNERHGMFEIVTR